MKLPGLKKYGNITLKQGVADSMVMYEWMIAGVEGEVERKTIEAAITQNDGNLTAAAEQLGVSRQTLYNKLKRFNL